MEHAPWATIPQLIDDAAARFPNTEGIGDGQNSLTFGQLADSIHQATRALMASGIAAGDRVSIWAPNTIEWAVAGLAVHCAGAVLVPINTRFKGSEAAYVLNQSKAKLLFTVSNFLDTNYVAMLDQITDLDHLEEVVVLRGTASGTSIPFTDFVARANQVDNAARAQRSAAVDGADLCHILFTSGTTGVPKGVMLEHQAICDVYLNLAKEFDLQHGDRQLIVLPFFHSFGLHVGIICGLMCGTTILPQLVFDTDAVMHRIADDKVTMFPGPPTIFQAMVQSPLRNQLDLSSLRGVTLGGASIPPTLVEDVQNHLGVARVQTGYGLTESSGTVSLCSPPATVEAITNTAGKPLPGLDVKIVDAQGKELPAGEAGEILVRGYVVMRGYLDDPEATAKAINAEGFLHTGDIGLLRDDGYLVVTDRLKDMYISGGFNAYPAEIEGMLANHDAIAQAAVIGIPDERLGEVGMAFILAATGAQINQDEIIAWSRERMANYKVPRVVTVVDELPTNATGKVLKANLRAMAAELLDN